MPNDDETIAEATVELRKLWTEVRGLVARIHHAGGGVTIYRDDKKPDPRILTGEDVVLAQKVHVYREKVF